MDLGSLLNPQAAQQAPGPGQDTWAAMFADPRAQAAILSIAGGLAQPPQFGQTGFGHFMSSVGAGGESVRQNEALDLKQQEADSKAILRESQAALAGAKAETSGARSDTSAARLELQRQANEDKNTRNSLGNVIRFQRMYQDHVKALQTANQKAALLGQPAVPVPSFNEWSAKSPQLTSMLGLSAKDTSLATGDETLPDSASPTAGGDPNEGRTATGPGGKKKIWRNGGWQDL